jgi:hypothetical protein
VYHIGGLTQLFKYSRTVLVQHDNCVVLHDDSGLNPGDARFVLCSFGTQTGSRCLEVNNLDAIERKIHKLAHEGRNGDLLIFNFEQRTTQPEPGKAAPAAAAAAAPPSYLEATKGAHTAPFPPVPPRW